MPIKVFSRAVEPFKNFKFRVYVDGRLVAGVSKMSGLKSTAEAVSHRSGGDPSTPVVSPGASKSEPVTLERGLTLDHTFEDWAKTVLASLGDDDLSLGAMRRNVTIEVLNMQGVPAVRYNVFACWVSEYTAVPELDANANAIAIEKIVLQNQGFERDADFAGEDPNAFQPAA
ncbi:MAG TPA: phage tail protein [Allosphingosinicella sp.]|nr:phage tail protein [Allosphingosinicella sp.]